MAFPKNFIWGAATSSYQIEGAYKEDGRGLSIWDAFSKSPGRVFNGDTGDIACDHYNRYKEDVALMKKIGLEAYRFSIAWSRIFPEGSGRVNEKGLDFYSRLVDELLEAGISPWATLYHWDMPLQTYYKGGWLNRETTDDFAKYTEVIVKKLGDRIKNWMTFNEPQCIIGLGYETGEHAPGLKSSDYEIATALHNHLIAHGKAVDVLRSYGGDAFSIGYVPTCQTTIPKDSSPEAIDIAREALFSLQDFRSPIWTISTTCDPVYKGEYPQDVLKRIEDKLPKGWEKDLENVGGKTDFLGVNLYFGYVVDKVDGKIQIVKPKPGMAQTALRWGVEEETLHWAPRFLYERYKKPVVITENGLSNTDWKQSDGRVNDPARIDFTRQYLNGLHRALENGADIAGYFHWSLMDNFEWAEGYRDRFGLIYVDFDTQERIIKESGHWYRKVIESNGELIL